MRFARSLILVLSTFYFLLSTFNSVHASVTSYEELLSAIRQTRKTTLQRIEQAVTQEKVREAWETGKLIDEHVLQHKERANYGEQILFQLAKDLGSNETELRFMLQLARAYPTQWPATELSWSHYQSLLALNDPKEREEVAAQAQKEKWTRDRLRDEVRKRKEKKGEREPAPALKLTPAQLGKVGTYRLVKASAGPDLGKIVIDLGFSNYYKTSKELRFKEGDILEAVPADSKAGSSPTDKIKGSKRTRDDLYTYRTHIFRVLDGDTVEAVVDLGFGVRSVQTLRLRGIDAPELVSREGKEAKKFLEQKLFSRESRVLSPENEDSNSSNTRLTTHDSQPVVLIKTTKSDKYDRYLADIFVPSATQGSAHKSHDYLYLNQKLLDEGLAVVVHD